MIKELDNHVKFDVRGTIKKGYKAVDANCPACNKQVKAIKPHDQFICPTCSSPVTPIPGSKEGMQSTPHFILPEEVAQVLGDKVTEFTIVPAYAEMGKTFPNSYTKFASNKMIACSSMDGVTAKRYDSTARAKVDVPCSEECPDRKNGTCKLTATFYVILPDVDVYNGYKLVLKSPQDIANIASTLNKLRNAEGHIIRTTCKLRLAGKKRKATGSTYYVLELLPPAVSIDRLQQFIESGGGTLAIGYSGGIAQAEKAAEAFMRSGQESNTTEPEVIDVMPPAAPTAPAATKRNAGDDQERLLKGKSAVKGKVQQLVQDPAAEKALERYAHEVYGFGIMDLTVEELLKLYYSLTPGSKAVKKISAIASAFGVSRTKPQSCQ